jgi:hypothetical protein
VAQLGSTGQEGAGQWQTRNDKRMLAVMTADRPGRDAQRREDLEPCLVAAHGDLHQTLLDQVNAL